MESYVSVDELRRRSGCHESCVEVKLGSRWLRAIMVLPVTHILRTANTRKILEQVTR